jgi:DME family drug/metabolite transporter
LFAVRRRDFLLKFLSGTLLAFSHAGYFAAIRSIGVTIPTLLAICLAPLIVTALSILLKLERLSWRIVVALALALLGSVLLVGFNPSATHPDQTLQGILLSVFAALTYAATVVTGRFLAADYHPLQITTLTFGASAIVLLVLNLVGGAVVIQTVQGWLLVLYLGLVPTALGYWLFQKGLNTVPATTASIVSMVDPFVAAILSWVLFGETIAATGVLGAVLLVCSIVLLSTGKQK